MLVSANLEIKHVAKYYKDFLAVDNISLSVKSGEFFTILGPSGSGKTSLLKLIAGFEETSNGHILINGKDVTKMKAYERNIGMVFQNYALFPHMTVFENVSYPLKLRKISKAVIKEKVEHILRLVDLERFGARYPHQLSGGQQQRVALARAIVFDPPLLLLDEPLAALDKNLRQKMQIELKHIQEKIGITTICVTHDQEEALTMSDRICVMNHGRIAQIDTPENLYKYPNSQFVAEFIGETNLIEGEVRSGSNEYVDVHVNDNLKIKVKIPAHDSRTNWVNQKVLIAIRPENMHITTNKENYDNYFETKVEEVIYVGDSIKAKVKTSFGTELDIKVPTSYASEIKANRSIRLGCTKEDITLIPETSKNKESVA
ncbi:ABC transporter ATP-binding protein [Brevibacillus sp. NRS-1366]|uniref:ABC transporter ATP-binding protein n=1 Tax=Brevibacillus sp. NRS-1366 TaxID=3233899 RepID=UPI003D1EE3FB